MTLSKFIALYQPLLVLDCYELATEAFLKSRIYLIHEITLSYLDEVDLGHCTRPPSVHHDLTWTIRFLTWLSSGTGYKMERMD